jgi:acetylornithine deacetylase/succinyl-diaminopimelate desuccinylase-like protein
VRGVLQVNIIPRWVNFTVDVRCKQQAFRQEVVDAIHASVAGICGRRGAKCTIVRTHDAAPVRAWEGGGSQHEGLVHCAGKSAGSMHLVKKVERRCEHRLPMFGTCSPLMNSSTALT